jgi:hypothetical protein
VDGCLIVPIYESSKVPQILGCVQLQPRCCSPQLAHEFTGERAVLSRRMEKLIVLDEEGAIAVIAKCPLQNLIELL